MTPPDSSPQGSSLSGTETQAPSAPEPELLLAVQSGLDTTLARLASAAQRAGRSAEELRLLAVSKKHPSSALRAAYACGQRDFGENYVQELCAKHEELQHLEGLRFHLIGPLQTNKVKYVVPFVSAIHSVASVSLIRELDKRALLQRPPEAGPIFVYLQINVSGEAQKSGASPAEAEELVLACLEARKLSLAGFMTMPPLELEAEAARPHFSALRQLRDELQLKYEARLASSLGLSMGMSQDLEVAVAEGASWIRVGTAIFGARAAVAPGPG